MNPAKYMEKIAGWLHAYQRPDEPPIRLRGSKYPAIWKMLLLRAYRGKGWALCRYRLDSQEQDAFNAVAACVPDKMRIKRPGRGGPEWTWIPPTPSSSDPLGQDGYIGAKWKTPQQ